MIRRAVPTVPLLYRFTGENHARVIAYRNGSIHFWHDERNPVASILYAVRGDGRNHLVTLESEKLEMTRAKNGRALHRRIFIHGFPVTDPRVAGLVQSLMRMGIMEELASSHTPPRDLE